MARTGRPPKPPATPDLPAVNEAAVRDALDAADTHAQRLIEIDAVYGDGLPYSRERMITEIRVHLERSAIDMLEAGKKLILLKEREPHGDFLEAVQKAGVHPDMAGRLMRAAVKFCKPNSRAHANLAELGKTKLLELAVLDDQEIAELTEGGTVAGLRLDDIDRMSSRELRKALRDARADKDATARVIEDKERKINELASDIHLRERFPDFVRDARHMRQSITGWAVDMDLMMQKARTLQKHVFRLHVRPEAEGQYQAMLPVAEGYVAALLEIRSRIDAAMKDAIADFGTYLTDPRYRDGPWDASPELQAYVTERFEGMRAEFRALVKDAAAPAPASEA